MKVLKRAARCPRCGRVLLTTGRIADEVRVLYTYIHADRKQHNHIEVIWQRDQKFYEAGVYDKLFRYSTETSRVKDAERLRALNERTREKVRKKREEGDSAQQ